MKVAVKVKLLNSDAKLPLVASLGAAGFDLYSAKDMEILPNSVGIVPLGIAVEIPEGYCIQIWDRSGIAKEGVHHFAGVIDSDYRGEVKILLFNSGQKPFIVHVGDRIAQGLLVNIFSPVFERSEDLSETKRGEGGFHSTGR